MSSSLVGILQAEQPARAVERHGPPEAFAPANLERESADDLLTAIALAQAVDAKHDVARVARDRDGRGVYECWRVVHSAVNPDAFTTGPHLA